MDNQINVFILCCGRYDLLQETLVSFKENVLENPENSDFSFKFFVRDDSGNTKLIDKVQAALSQNLSEYDVSFDFGEENYGQSRSFLKLVEKSNLESDDYILMIEEDWQFLLPVSIRKMINVYEKMSEIFKVNQVILRTDIWDDVSSMQKLVESRRNIIEFSELLFICGTNKMKNICQYFGGSPGNDDLCFHPHLTICIQ